MNRAAPVSVLLAFGPYSCANRVNSKFGGWTSCSTGCFTPMLFPEVLNADQGGSMYPFSNLWYDSTGYRALTYRVHSEHYTIGPRMRWLEGLKIRNQPDRFCYWDRPDSFPVEPTGNKTLFVLVIMVTISDSNLTIFGYKEASYLPVNGGVFIYLSMQLK